MTNIDSKSPPSSGKHQKERKSLLGPVLDDLYTSVGAETAASLLSAYVEEMEMRAEQLSYSISVADRDSFVTQAHSLKGASSTFGATLVETEARALEMAGRNGDELHDEMLGALLIAMGHTKVALSAEIGRRPQTDGQ